MSSSFLLISIFGAVLLFVLFWVIWFEWRLRRLLRGESGKSLEEVIIAIGKELERLDNTQEEIGRYLQDIERRLRKSVQGVGIVRFNPFQDAGGDQSFAIAFMDEHKNGVVFSSLYSREGVRVYAKPLKAGISNYQLSPEEKQAIEKALST